MHRRILENSIGWNDRLPKCTHSRAPSIGREEQRRHQEDAGHQQQQVAVALQVAGVADHEQRERRRAATPERGPGRLALGLARVPAGDDDVADPVEQGGQRAGSPRWRWGASQRLAMWATRASPSTMPRKAPMLSGIFDFCPRTAMT